ncbi:hypothetical protein AMEX_G14347 [Astyanax mexicanus]|uniref:Uncharacterized protein n=1 Tax=Astyanax mexicanus TaxID=7994 RepID=A0A8B9JGD1_ASTMX|nr:hypothetical protein AMEX_G14347 [Astyanax mexicanus]
MESRRLKRDIEALLGEYIGQKLRENGFDPKGKGMSVLDDMAHYDLAVSVALWWLEKEEKKSPVEKELIGVISPGHSQYPNRLEREAMILSSFAGMLLNSLPVEDILSLYSCKPSASCPHQGNKSNIIHPFTLSYHPFAMLSSYKAVEHSKKHTKLLKHWNSERNKGASTKVDKEEKAPSVSSSSSSSSSYSDSEDSLKEQRKHYEGSQESLQA